VIVPVLPQQISSISPIVSGAYKFFTKILSLSYILITLKARETPIVRGRPSGIATITKTTIRFMVFGKSLNKAVRADTELKPIFMIKEIISSRNIITPEIKARNVKCSLRFFNFF
jgi:hypothetical protein